MPEQPKVIRRRIKSVSSTRKITRTMEMVATAKLRVAQQRVQSSGPYMAKLRQMMQDIGAAGVDVSRWPHFERRAPDGSVLLFLLTANRGLCGAFNANLVRLARRTWGELKERGREVRVRIAGRKGAAAFRFMGIPAEKTYVEELTDRPTPADAEFFLRELAAPFLEHEVDEVVVVYPHWQSIARQPPTLMRLLPIVPEELPGGAGAAVPPLFEPSAEAILDTLLPLYLRQSLYAVLAERVASEQLARRTAMKLATDNAEEMVTSLTRVYNRARQAQITKEICEILGGTEALKE
ncbi:MAG: ATP synthase F1 subunit gamma [Planctomycetota bacterium]